MSNKNKRSTAAKAKKASKAASAANTKESTPVPPTDSRLFTSSQLSALIFLAMGMSQLMQYASALTEAEKEGPNKVCMSYLLDEETCNDPGFSSLIQAKYYSGINLLAITAFMVLIVWKTETYFSKLMTCLCITPISTTVLGIYMAQEHISKGKTLHIMLICFALLATSTPNSRDKIPFLAEQTWKNVKTLQGLALMGLVFTNLLDIYRANTLPSLMDAAMPTSTSVSLLVNFWCVDKISMALLFFYAMVHFPERIQRKFLSLAGLHQLVQFYYQLPRMTYPFANQQEVKYILLTSAIFSIVAWKGPSIAFKKDLTKKD